MSDPAVLVAATIRYEIRICQGPRTVRICGVDHEVGATSDLVTLVRVVQMDRSLVEEKIVGVIGGEYRSDSREFLRLLKFLNQGGVIGLHRDLVDR